LKPRRAKKGLHCPKAHFLDGNPHVHNSFSQQKKREEGEHIQPEPPLTNRNSSCRATAIPRRKISKEKNYSKNAHSLPEKLAMHAQKKSTKSAARVSGDLHLSAEYLASHTKKKHGQNRLPRYLAFGCQRVSSHGGFIFSQQQDHKL